MYLIYIGYTSQDVLRLRILYSFIQLLLARKCALGSMDIPMITVFMDKSGELWEEIGYQELCAFIQHSVELTFYIWRV